METPMTPSPAKIDDSQQSRKPPAGRLSGRAAPGIAPTDGERLMRFRVHRDEAAFREVVAAHAALVWSVCWQVLRHRQDAEDAFQATFLILARKARSIRAADSAAGWLYRVAFRTALVARGRRQRRAEEPLAEEPLSPDDQLAAVHRREQCLTLLEELHALPARYRKPLAMCYLEGKSRGQAAEELGVTLASVKGSLARGTRLLRTRLARRGVALSGAMAATQAATAQAAMGPTLVETTAAMSTGFTLRSTGAMRAGSLRSDAVATLAEKGLTAMTLSAIAKPACGLFALCVAGALAVAAPEAPEPADGALAIDSGAAEIDGNLAASADAAPAVDVAIDAGDGGWNENVDAVAPSEAHVAQALASAGGWPAPASAAPAQPPADILVPTPPGDVPVQAPVAAASPPTPGHAPMIAQTATGQPNPYRAPQPVYAPQPAVPAAAPSPQPLWNAPAQSLAASSRESLDLEIEYWDLKARGLEMKAAALRRKAESLKTAIRTVPREGPGADVEALEAEADAALTLAEVALCKANMQRLKDALEAQENPASQPAHGPSLDALRRVPPPKEYGEIIKRQLEAITGQRYAPGYGPWGPETVYANPYSNPPQDPGPTRPAPTTPAAPSASPPPAAPQAAQPWTPQNTWVNPVNPPQGPGVAPYPSTVVVPPVAGPATPQVEALIRQVEDLKAANERLSERLEELEGAHGHE
jgi:RNA polymerase sigma factor (sigma-70 family)